MPTVDVKKRVLELMREEAVPRADTGAFRYTCTHTESERR